MQETFIKLDRSLLKHRYFDNVNVLKVWLWCLMKASHKKHSRLIGLQTVELDVGEFVTGRNAAARDLNIPGTTAWTILKLFENDKKIVIKSNNKFSVISVIDYSTYQVLKYQGRQQDRQQADNSLAANGQQSGTNNNGNKGKKKTLDDFLRGKVSQAFETVYADYPRKEGRKEALVHYKASVKTVKDVAKISEALDTYIAQVKGKDRQYVQKASTWFNNWQDYIPSGWEPLYEEIKQDWEKEYEDNEREEDGLGADDQGLL